MIRRSSLLLLEVALGLVATAAIAVGLAWWRLSAGPIAVPQLERHVEAELAAARGGRAVSIAGVELAWSAQSRAFELRALDVRALDDNGGLLSRSDMVGFRLAPFSLLTGRVAMQEARFDGGALTLTLAKDGSAGLAFGPPGSPSDITIPPPPPNETLNQRVNRILDGLSDVFRPLGPGGALRDLTIENVVFTVVDEASGARWVAQGAGLALRREADLLRMALSARLQGPRGLAPIAAQVTTDVAFAGAVVEAQLQGAELQTLFPEALLGVLAPLQAPITATVSVGLDRAAGVTSMDGDVSVGRGYLRLGKARAPIDGGRVRGRYDLESDALVIEEAALAGARTRMKGEGRIARASRLLAAAPDDPAAFDLAFDSVTMDMPGAFQAPVAVRALTIRGALVPAERRVQVDAFSFSADRGRARLSGDLYWEPDANGLARFGARVSGAVDGEVTPATVLSLWPLHFAKSARDYLSKALVGGRLSAAVLKADLTPQAIAQRRLADKDLTLTFNFADANVAYVEGMNPITAGKGRAVLKGNAFELWLDEGQSGGLALSQGKVEIPKFNPKGAPARFSGVARGGARAMIDLLRQAPLDLDARLPFKPETIVGQGEARFSITRPLLDNVPAEAIGFTVDAKLDGVGAQSKDSTFAVADWALSVNGDEKSLTFAGPLGFGRSSAELTWTEALKDGGETPSRFTLSGQLLSGDIERLGYPIELIASGPVGVGLRGAGVGFDIANVALDIDLTGADMALPRRFWSKAGGEGPARARFSVQRLAEGGYAVSGLELRGPGLSVDGAAQLDADGGLVRATFGRVDIADRARGAMAFRRTASGGLHMDFQGPLFHVGAVATGQDAPIQAARYKAEPVKPFDASIEAATLAFNGGVSLRDGRVLFQSDKGVLESLDLRGRDPRGSLATVAITPKPGSDHATIAFSARDAGLAWKALTGQDTVRGGVAAAEGVWRPGAPSTAELTLRMQNFELVNMPVMARLLSSVGSLTGMADMLGGEGIAFATLEAPISFVDGRITFGECRMAGPSLGLTAKGKMDLESGALAIDGVVVPSYGLNSMLGGLPVLGELLTSRKGEGVVGLTYSIKGPADKAKVGVNPLSALTPGILRRIFEPLAPLTPKTAESGPAASSPGAPSAPVAPSSPSKSTN